MAWMLFTWLFTLLENSLLKSEYRFDLITVLKPFVGHSQVGDNTGISGM
jgi:hypothetical protein